MGTTSNGLPYPEPTDDLRDGAGAIQALAVALDQQGTIGNKTNVPQMAGATGTCTAVRIGSLVVVEGYVTGIAFPNARSTNFVDVGGLPAALRPAGNAFCLGYYNGPFGVVFARADGSVATRNDSGAERTVVQFTLIYPLNTVVVEG